MKKHLIAAFVAITVAAPVIAPTAVEAQRHHRDDRGIRDHRWQGDRNSNWDPARHYNSRGHHRERRLGRHDRIYRGGDGRYYCKRNDGTTGLVIGGVAGGLLGNAIGGDTLGTLLGAGGGALLGREIDRGDVKCR
ncbi:MAG TPA: glycine zipper 2TM domain-containing protein [Sphingomonadaceae bacterium]|jgi:Ni/Co efflux regulator RcnB|nr:glycine zipper 2TM domain-containing protein [Sphingomonadaceae bacterium]